MQGDAPRPQQDPVQVLYIAGSGRCGSTVFANALGECQGIFSPGELRYFWDRGTDERNTCGCGQLVTDCSLWSQVSAALEARGAPSVPRMGELHARLANFRNLPLLVSPRGRRRLGGDLDEYIQGLAVLYRAVQSVTGARVIVDASKTPAYAAILRLVPELRLSVLHLVRDPRAVAYSWQRNRDLVPAGGGRRRVAMPTFGPVTSVGLWMRWNAGAEWFRFALPRDRYQRLRYEDFVEDPVAGMRTALRMVDAGPQDYDFATPAGLELSVNHTVSGNPSRFRTGPVRLRNDDEWQRALSRADRRMVSALTAPLRMRYGYRG